MTELLKDWTRQGLGRLGLKLSVLRTLPVGIDLGLDLRRYVPAGRLRTIFDVGANVGQSAVKFARQFPAAQVFSFEPVEATYQRLVARTRGLPNVRCIRSALGAAVETRRLFHQRDCQCNSLAEGANRATAAGSSEEVPVTTIDDFCAREGIGRIDLLKTDTEGFDLEVLRGAAGLLGAGRVRFVYSEVTFDPADDQHTPFFPLAAFLREHDLQFVALYDQLATSHLTGSLYSNALFAHAAAPRGPAACGNS